MKRILSAFLAFIMVFALCPVIAFDSFAASAPIDINGVTLGSYNKLFYWKYIHDGKGDNSGNSNSSYTFPFSLSSPQNGNHSQMIIPSSFGDQDTTEFSTHEGKYITRIEFVLLGHYHANGENNGAYYYGNASSAKYKEMQQLAADMRNPDSSNYVKLGDIVLKLGTTSDKTKYSNNSDYVTTGLTEVEISDFYITPYDHVADGGGGGENDYFDMLVIELETPYYYDGKNIVIDVTLGDGWDNFSSQKVSGDNSYYWRNNKNSDTYCLGADGSKISGRMPRFKINFSDGTPNYTVTNTAAEGELPQVTVQDKSGTALSSDTYVPKYVGRGSTVYAETTAVPTDAGDYTMILDFGAANNGYTGKKYVDFYLDAPPVNPDEINVGNEVTTVIFDTGSGQKTESNKGATSLPINLWGGGSENNYHSQMLFLEGFYNSGDSKTTIRLQSGKALKELKFVLNGTYDLDSVNRILASASVKVQAGTSETSSYCAEWIAADHLSIKEGLQDVKATLRIESYTTDKDVLVVEFAEPLKYDGDNIVIDFKASAAINIGSPKSGTTGFYYLYMSASTMRVAIGSDKMAKDWLPFTIFAFEKENIVVDYDPNEQIYTDNAGNGKRPTIKSVYDTINKINLVEGTHYSVYFCDATGIKITGAPTVPGSFQMVLDFDGVNKTYEGTKYTGKKVIPFTVQRGFDVTIVIENNNTKYTGKEIDPVVKVYRDAAMSELVPESEYYIITNEGEKPMNAGDYTVVVYQSGNTGAKMTATFTIDPAPNSITNLTMENWAYGENGNEPSFNAAYGANNAVKTYFDANGNQLSGKPVNAGSYTVKVTIPADGNYGAAEATATFTIAPKSLVGNVMVDESLTVNDGTAKNENVPVSLSGSVNQQTQIIVLESDLQGLVGKDITSLILYVKPLWDGEVFSPIAMTVKIGTTEKTSFQYSDAYIEGLTEVYTGTVSAKDNTLVLNFKDTYHYDGKNLVIEFIDNDTTENLYFSFLGQNLSQQLTLPYNLYKFVPKMTFNYEKSVPAVSVTNQTEDDFIANGNAQGPALSVTLADGTELQKGTEYIVTYTGTDVNGNDYNSTTAPSLAGTYTATVSFTGNYTGEDYSVPFTISKGEAKLTVTLDGWHVGKTPNKPVVSENSSGSTVTYQYKLNDGVDTYKDINFDDVNTIPTAPGTYKLKAFSAGADGYPDATIEIVFTITSHTLIDIAAQEKTCIQDGWDAYKKCTTDGCGYVSEHNTYAKGHVIVDGAAKEATTCGDTFWAAYTYCSVCGGESTKREQTLQHADNNGDHKCDKCNVVTGQFDSFVQGTVNAIKGVKGIYKGIVTYGNGDIIVLSMGAKEFFRLNEDGSLYLCGYQVEGTYPLGTYSVTLTVNRKQQMVTVEVTLPEDGGTIRRNTYELLENNDADSYEIVAQAYDGTDVAGSECTYVTISSEGVQLVETAPSSGNIYNLTTSFNDARYDRAFAWTVQNSWLQSLGANGMAIRYEPYNESGKDIIVDATQVGEYNGERYFKVDISDLQAGQTYYYKIGIKKANGEYEWHTELLGFQTSYEHVTDFTFGVIGDTHANTQWNNSKYTNAVMQKILNNQTKFLLHTGDLVDSDNANAAEWNEFFTAIYQKEPIPLFAASGNHDPRAVSGNNYFYNWHFNNPDNGYLDNTYQSGVGHNSNLYSNMGETFYSFDYGNTHFIVLNSGNYGSTAGDDNLLLAQKAWLIEDLQKNQHAQWTVVMVHQPVYHRYTGDADISRRALHDVFESYGVDLVIQGHSHLVTRSYPVDANGNFIKNLSNPDIIEQGTGTVYITVGSTATNHDKIAQNHSNNMMLISTPALDQPTYTTVSVTNGSLVVTIKQLDGLVVDTFTITGTKDSETISHTFGTNIETLEEPTCTTTGVGLKSCTICDYQEKVELKALGHISTTVPGYPATCTETGLTDGTKCTRCGNMLVDQNVIRELGHAMKTDAQIDATCTAEGKTERKYCTRCDYVEKESEIIRKIPHADEVYENDDGDRVHRCTVCGTEWGKYDCHNTQDISCDNAHQVIYTATVTYGGTGNEEMSYQGNGDVIYLYSESFDLLYMEQGSGIDVMGCIVSETIARGTYSINVIINPVQGMITVELTMPDGNVIRRSQYIETTDSISDSIGVMSIDEDDVTNIKVVKQSVTSETVNDLGDFYHFVTYSPKSDNAKRVFTWTATASQMTLRYKKKSSGGSWWENLFGGGSDNWTETTVTGVANDGSVYTYEVEIDGLATSTEYSYEILNGEKTEKSGTFKNNASDSFSFIAFDMENAAVLEQAITNAGNPAAFIFNPYAISGATSYEHGDVHFIVMDNDTASNWLESDLQKAKASIKVVIVNEITADQKAVCEANGVNLVICGNDNVVTHTASNGVVYLTIGSTAGNRAKMSAYKDLDMKYVGIPAQDQSTYAIFDVEGNEITVTVKQSNGLVLDTFDINASHVHTSSEQKGQAPTCTDTGLTDGSVCSECGYIIVPQVEIPATGHNFKAATCTEPQKCQNNNCDATEGAALGHSYNEPEWTWGTPDPNLFVAYTATFACKNCTHKEKINSSQPISPNATTNATCTEDGCYQYIGALQADLDGDGSFEPYSASHNITIPKLGHAYGEPQWNWNLDGETPACTATFTCTREGCNDQKIESNVTITSEITKAATCTEKGSVTYTATYTLGENTYTNHSEPKEIPALNHNFTGAPEEEVPGTNMVKVKCVNENCNVYDYRVVQSEGSTEEDKTVVVTPEESENKASHEFGKELFEAIADEAKEFVLNVKSSILDLVFDNSSVQTIKSLFVENDDEISVSVDDKTEIAEGATTAGKLRFDIYLSKNNQKVEHTEFGEGFVTVTIPLARLGDLTGKNVKVYYVERDEQGNETNRTEMIEGFNFDRTKNEVTFKTNHFSEYEVEATNAHVHNYTVAWNWVKDDNNVYTAATATFTCGGETGCGDVQTVDATVTVEDTDANQTVYTATVEFNGNSDSDSQTVDKTNGYAVTLDDRSVISNNTATTTLDVSKKYNTGDTFTVTSAFACVVAISTDGGATYTELTCVAVEGVENTYKFTIPTITSDFQIGIVLRGDARGDGNVKVNDATRIQRYLTEGLTTNNTLDSLTILAADARGDGNVKVNDATRIQRYLTEGLTTNNMLEWKLAK